MKQDSSIYFQNIYYMLSYAFRDLHLQKEKFLAGESFENIHNLFAAILGKCVSEQLKQGLFREYRERSDTLNTVRGRIQMADTIRVRQNRARTMVCAYDELSENNLCNRIVKTTIGLLIRHPEVEESYRDSLRKVYFRFRSVDRIDPAAIPWSTVRIQRGNRNYGLLLGICQLVLEGMLLTTDSGDYHLASFVDDQNMHRLYEKFLLEYYRREWQGFLSARPAQIFWALDDNTTELLPAMLTDITLERGNQVLIMDAKYYREITQSQFNRHSIRSAHLYQLFAYVKNRSAGFGNEPHEVSGMLLYARTDEAVLPDVTYHMSGNRISVRTLDLNRPFPEIAAALDNIVREHFTAG